MKYASSGSVSNSEDYDKLVVKLANDAKWNAFPPEIRQKHLADLQEDLAEDYISQVCDDLKKEEKEAKKPARKSRKKNDSPSDPVV